MDKWFSPWILIGGYVFLYLLDISYWLKHGGYTIWQRLPGWLQTVLVLVFIGACFVAAAPILGGYRVYG